MAEWDLGVGGEDGVLDPGTGPAGPGFDRVFFRFFYIALDASDYLHWLVQ